MVYSSDIYINVGHSNHSHSCFSRNPHGILVEFISNPDTLSCFSIRWMRVSNPVFVVVLWRVSFIPISTSVKLSETKMRYFQLMCLIYWIIEITLSFYKSNTLHFFLPGLSQWQFSSSHDKCSRLKSSCTLNSLDISNNIDKRRYDYLYFWNIHL